MSSIGDMNNLTEQLQMGNINAVLYLKDENLIN